MSFYKDHVWGDKQPVSTFDGVNGANNALQNINLNQADNFVVAHFRQSALSTAINFASACSDGDFTDDDDQIVSLSDALDRYIADATSDFDSEEDDDDGITLWMGAFTDALSTLGVSDEVISDMFDDDIDTSDSAIQSMSQTVLANLPDDGEPIEQFVDDFVFVGEPVFDAMAGKHTVKKLNGKKIHYQGTWAIRGGKKVVVNKRMPNQKVRLTTRQKAGLKKARQHAFTANAMKKRIKSFMKSQKLNLGKK